jgi:hypothetical protein
MESRAISSLDAADRMSLRAIVAPTDGQLLQDQTGGLQWLDGSFRSGAGFDDSRDWLVPGHHVRSFVLGLWRRFPGAWYVIAVGALWGETLPASFVGATEVDDG